MENIENNLSIIPVIPSYLEYWIIPFKKSVIIHDFYSITFNI